MPFPGPDFRIVWAAQQLRRQRANKRELRCKSPLGAIVATHEFHRPDPSRGIDPQPRSIRDIMVRSLRDAEALSLSDDTVRARREFFAPPAGESSDENQNARYIFGCKTALSGRVGLGSTP
jgi:hypothetical protein